jgi:hypothetical protein
LTNEYAVVPNISLINVDIYYQQKETTWGTDVVSAATVQRRLLILKAFSILVIAAALEVGGDALIRIGLEGATYSIAAGALTPVRLWFRGQ